MLRVILVFLFACAQLVADEPIPEMVGVPANTVHQGDYLVIGNNVEISGVVEGDVYIIATQAIVDGHVKGDLLLCVANAEISGKIDHNIRIVAGQAMISGDIGGSVSMLCGNVHIPPAADIEGNLVCAGGSVEVAGNIMGSATVSSSFLRVSGKIGDELTAYVGKMRISSRASIARDLNYRSSENAYIDPEAHIGGHINREPTLFTRLFRGGWIQNLLVGSKLAVVVMNFLYSFVIGWILLRLFPKNVEAALEALSNSPLKAFGYGLMLLVLLPLASLILLMTILGAPFALTLIALNVIGFYTVKIFSILWAVEEVFKRSKWHIKRLSALALGLLLYFLLLPIPYLGFILTITVLIFGLGAGAAASLRRKL
ncbi:MAG: polymer-forming cytoskeletal protein [Chlamydiales bacterium]|nr:polymer-forming cytoskeletal protein [Chlamydiales bacterium]